MKFNKDTGILFLKGMAMGAADSVPGVSGGTIALVTNIYEELVESIGSVGWHTLTVWRHEGLAAAWRSINGNFLLTLLAGILTSLLILANLVVGLMENHQPLLLAFFFGLVLASIRYVAGQVKRWQPSLLLFSGAGMVFALALSMLPVSSVTPGLWYYFLSGAVAICAMILPGISGAFILVLLGAYFPVLDALTSFHLSIVLVFMAGCVTGLMLFTRLLNWLLHHHHERTLATLIGILVGSLGMLWPWRVATELASNGHAVTTLDSVMPAEYLRLTGDTVSPGVCLLLAAIGAGLVIVLETLSQKPGREG